MSKPVLVIIGAGGIGVACARRSGSGRLIFLAGRNTETVRRASQVLTAEGYDIEHRTVDVANPTAVNELALEAAATGRLEAVIHTAGISPTMGTTEDHFNINLYGTACVIEAFYQVAGPGMSLVCITSMAAYLAAGLVSNELARHLALAKSDSLLSHDALNHELPSHLAYIISKRGNQVRVEAEAGAWGEKGARINSISPGTIMTPMSRVESEGPSGERMRSMIENSPIAREGTATEVANVAAFLVGTDSSFITGTDIRVDGGCVPAQLWSPAPDLDDV